MDLIEATSNAVIGLCVSWAATYWLLPLWGLHPSATASAGITALFFTTSFLRAYVLRKLFRKITNTGDI